MCGYLGAGMAGLKVGAAEASWQSINKIARDRKTQEIDQIKLEREKAGREAARTSEEIQIRREQERQITADTSQELLKKEMREQATAEVEAEYRGVKGGSVEAFKNQLTRDNLAAMEQNTGNFQDLKNHLARMISDNWESYRDNLKSFDIAEEYAEITRQQAVPDIGMLRLGQLDSIWQGAAFDYKYGTPWNKGKWEFTGIKESLGQLPFLGIPFRKDPAPGFPAGGKFERHR